jgi:AcrR family transcriptional regulator
LIIKRGYERITIADITEQANLGRTTFYLHYRDKEHLLQESIKTLLYDMHLDVEPETEKPCTYNMISVRIFQHVERRRQLYQAMLKEAGPTRTIEDVMRNYFTELCQRFLPENLLKTKSPSLVNSEILAVHAAGSLLGLLSWWLKQETTLSAEDMGTVYCQLMANLDD